MAATHAHGTTFSWNGKTVAGLTAINGIELTMDTVDVTTHQSSNSYKEYIAGLIDAGEVGIEGLFDATDTDGQQAMMTDFNGRTSRAAIITFPASTGTTWSFTGFITNIKIGDAPIDGAIPFSATIKPTGKPTFAVATSAGLTNPFFTLSNDAVLAPAASSTVYDYVATVLTAVDSITVTPTASAGTITVNGSTVVSGQASSTITLGAAGSITVVTIVVTETNKAPKTYTIRVVRA
jgi:predicted secreted protein